MAANDSQIQALLAKNADYAEKFTGTMTMEQIRAGNAEGRVCVRTCLRL
jgi:hypothetical protein